MHLAFIPVVYTKDKDENKIDKVCNRDFWKDRDSYRKLQNAFYDDVSSKGFNLEKGLEMELQLLYFFVLLWYIKNIK